MNLLKGDAVARFSGVIRSPNELTCKRRTRRLLGTGAGTNQSCRTFLILFRSSVVERGPLEADVSGSNPDGTTILLRRISVVHLTLDQGRLVRFQSEQPGIPAEPERLRTQRNSGWSGSGRKQQPYKRAGSSPGYIV